MGHAVWRVFSSGRIVLRLAREENDGSWDENQDAGPEKGPFSPGAPRASVCPCQNPGGLGWQMWPGGLWMTWRVMRHDSVGDAAAATRLTVWPPLASTPLPLYAATGPDPFLLPQPQARPPAPACLLEGALRGIFLSEDLSSGSWGAPGSIFGLPLTCLRPTGQWAQEGLVAPHPGVLDHPPSSRPLGRRCRLFPCTCWWD